MSLVIEQARDYFASLNPLAKKIFQELDVLKQSRGESWERLTEEERDETIDRYFVEDSIREKYPTQSEDYPSSFPQLKVPPGEKIVVDFDKDCWTWRDEHSSPFSWETRSQQDLSLIDDDPDEGLGNENSDNGTGKRPKKPPRKSRSPEQDANLAFKPERSIWESPFLAADRGLDGGYHSSLTSDQSKSSEESDDILHKFGISLSLGGSSNMDFDEELKLLDNFDVKEAKSKPHSDTDSVFTANTDSPELQPRSRENASSSEAGIDLNLNTEPVEAIGGDEVLMPKFDKDPEDRDRGHVSPVYIEDPGESSDSIDNFTSHQTGDEYLVRDRSSDVLGNVNNALDSETRLDDLQDESKVELVRTGFDFLDNW